MRMRESAADNWWWRVDGPHHLADVEAYRRDRRKDALLQENGYFVLRFLADDVGKQLDHVLDTLLHVLARCEARIQVRLLEVRP